MKHSFRPILCFLFVSMYACGTSEAPHDGTNSEPDVAADVAVSEDIVIFDTADSPDVAPPPVLYLPPDEQLRASVAYGSMGVPLGASTSGYGQSPDDDAPVSPFATIFQATETIVQAPGVRILHLVKGDQRVILVVTDIVGIYYTHFEHLVDLVEERIGLDISENLVLMANHSHAGPAGVVNIDLAAFVMDVFNPAYTHHVMSAITEHIVTALSVESVPVNFGYAVTQNAEMHKDRRCENPEYQNDRLGIFRFDKADGSGPLAVLLNYSMHGTVLSPGDGCLSGDAPRTVEQKVRELVEGNPMVMFLQSWAGDMAPGSPEIPEAPFGSDDSEFNNFNKMEALGLSAFNTVDSVWDSMEMYPDVSMEIRTLQVPFSREDIGYEDGEFEFEFGGFLCGGTEKYCEDKQPNMHNCLPVPESYSIKQTRLSAIRLGEIVFVTLPGEPLTTLGEYVVDGARVATGAEEAFLLGYAQDYTGYLPMPDDWALGGYEAASNFWGPDQAVYLADSVISIAAKLFDDSKELNFSPVEALDFSLEAGEAYEPGISKDPGVVVQDVAGEVAAGAIVRFGFKGGDPWFGTPKIELYRKIDGSDDYEPFVSGGRIVDVDSYRVHVSMEAFPSWRSTLAHPEDGRAFVWWTDLRTAVTVPGPDQILEGIYQFRVHGRAMNSAGTAVDYSLESAPFDVQPGAAK
jgi:hypothetical protein